MLAARNNLPAIYPWTYRLPACGAAVRTRSCGTPTWTRRSRLGARTRRWRSCKGRLQTRINMRVRGKFRLGELLPTQECTITFYHCIPERSCQRPHAHAQVPSHRSPSVERFRIHVKGMVDSSGWLDGFPEVGCSRGPWRRRWAKDLLDASATGKNNSLRRGAACQRLCKNCNRAATQPSL